jgi:hypothetical protein
MFEPTHVIKTPNTDYFVHIVGINCFLQSEWESSAETAVFQLNDDGGFNLSGEAIAPELAWLQSIADYWQEHPNT